MEPIVSRYRKNPILTKDDVPYAVETVHNAGAARYDGRYLLVFRSHRRNGRSILGLAESDDGYHFRVRPEPFMTPAVDGHFAQYEEFGVEDCRVAALEGWYWLTYSAYSRHGVRIGLARTRDFQSVERVAMISQCDMRNVVLFPERIGGLYVRLDRPHSDISPWSIWTSTSPDLVHWGQSRLIIRPAPYHWDEDKIGPGATPIRTTSGWLSIYHGVFSTMSGGIYRLGVALHDLADPSRVLGVADDWILQPADPWEVTGYVSNVVFTCGAIAEDDGTLKLYWGGADSVMCVGTANIQQLVDLCLRNPRPALGAG
jgi:predicted GH43/DUF377 family glycosyl hydrolase